MLPRVLPFALFMAFIGLNALLQALAPEAEWLPAALVWLYPVRTAVVVAVLVYFWRDYDELRTVDDRTDGRGQSRPWTGAGDMALAVLVGVAVYLAWVRMDWPWATQGADGAGYDPFIVEGPAAYALAAVRLLGAAAVVPLMEELFWRSFIMRYLVNSDFATVRPGAFTPLSFGATVVLFGVEHNLWLAGMMAGVAYALLLYRSGNLWTCIWAHAVTNLALGMHVLVRSEWRWW